MFYIQLAHILKSIDLKQVFEVQTYQVKRASEERTNLHINDQKYCCTVRNRKEDNIMTTLSA